MFLQFPKYGNKFATKDKISIHHRKAEIVQASSLIELLQVKSRITIQLSNFILHLRNLMIVVNIAY